MTSATSSLRPDGKIKLFVKPLFDKKKWVTCGLNRCASPHIKSSASLICNDCYYRGYDGPQLSDQLDFFGGAL